MGFSFKKLKKTISNPKGKDIGKSLLIPGVGIPAALGLGARYLQKKVTHSKALRGFFGNGPMYSAQSYSDGGSLYGSSGSIVGRY